MLTSKWIVLAMQTALPHSLKAYHRAADLQRTKNKMSLGKKGKMSGADGQAVQ